MFIKKTIFFLALLVVTSNLLNAQSARTRHIARGAEPGELYFMSWWYGIYATPFPSDIYDTLRLAVYRISENGKK